MGANTIRIENHNHKKTHLKYLDEICEESKELYIYHILPLEHLIKMTDNRRWFLTQICSSWEDPYELWGVPITSESDDTRRCFYGQSWSTLRDSDALWRIYSSNRLSVRVKSSIQKICNSIDFECNEYTITLGRVSYKTKTELSKLYNKTVNNFSKEEISESLFFKRNNFSHESEVRLILAAKKNTYNKLWSLNIDPLDIIYEVYFDPRLDAGYAKFLMDALRLKMPDVTISQSPLYKSPIIKR